MKHVITKEFDFCYGHRVWSQTLNAEYSLDTCLKCRHLHGHQGKIAVSLEASHLTDGMVTDFKHLNWFKKWVDDVLDHKFIMDINDPLLPFECSHLYDGHREIKGEMIHFNPLEQYWTINLSRIDALKYEVALKEKYEGMVFVPFVPTSENLSKWFFEIVREKMLPLKVQIYSVAFNETPKSMAQYIL